MALTNTKQDYYDRFADTIKFHDSRTAPRVRHSLWDIFSTGLSHMMYLNEQFSVNRFMVAFASQSAGQDLDFLLDEYGLQARKVNVPATMQMMVSNPTGATITLNQGDIFKYSNISYEVSITTNIPAGAINYSIPLISTVVGTGQQIIAGAVMTPAVATALTGYTVFSCNDGLTYEDDSSVMQRVLSHYKYKSNCGQLVQFANWAMEVDNITNAFAFIDPYDSDQIRVACMGGGFDVETIISNDALAYSRTPTADLVQQAFNIIMTNRYPTAWFRCVPVVTYGFTELEVTARISLLSGYSLTTTLADFGGITVETLIKRQIRRAILMTPIGGNQQINTDGELSVWMYASDIESILDLTLGLSATTSGFVKPMLTNRQVTLTVNGGVLGTELQLPKLYDDVADASPAVYDIDINNITLVVV